MNLRETAEVLAVLHAVYPQTVGQTDNALRAKMNVWQEVLSDEPVSVVMAAAKAFIATDARGFMPVPGQIKEQIAVMKNQAEITEQEAWDMVMMALKNSAYNSQEEYARLPEEIKRAVGSHNMLRSWASVNYNELQTIIASQFKNSYKAILTKKKALDKIPENVKAIVSGDEKKRLGS